MTTIFYKNSTLGACTGKKLKTSSEAAQKFQTKILHLQHNRMEQVKAWFTLIFRADANPRVNVALVSSFLNLKNVTSRNDEYLLLM